MKQIFLKFPEYYLIIATILAGYSPPFFINPICLGIVVLLILQIIFKNRIVGLIVGSLFLLANLYFIGALISEFNEFTEFTINAKQLIFFGLSIWTLNMVTSVTMIYKYVTPGIKSNSRVVYNQQKS